MAKITESQLKNLASKLNEKLDENQLNEVDWAGLGQKALGAVKGAGQWMAQNPLKTIAGGAAAGAAGAATTTGAATATGPPTGPLTIRTLPSASVISSSETLDSETKSIKVLSFLKSI